MYTWLKYAAIATVAAILALTVWGCIGVAHHLIMALDGITQTTTKLNGPHGTIAMADEDIGAAKSLIIHADLVARHEQQSLNTWDARAAQLFDNINGGVTDLRGAINAGADMARAATGTVGAMQGTASAGTDLLAEAAKSFRQVNDPHVGIAATLGNLNGGIDDARKLAPEVARGVTAGADTAQHIDGITGDFQTALHPILNPDPCKTRACKVKRGLGAVKAAGGGAEGLYYMVEVLKMVL